MSHLEGWRIVRIPLHLHLTLKHFGWARLILWVLRNRAVVACSWGLRTWLKRYIVYDGRLLLCGCRLWWQENIFTKCLFYCCEVGHRTNFLRKGFFLFFGFSSLKSLFSESLWIVIFITHMRQVFSQVHLSASHSLLWWVSYNLPGLDYNMPVDVPIVSLHFNPVAHVDIGCFEWFILWVLNGLKRGHVTSF